MNNNWDKFPLNLAEMVGKIKRDAFIFNYNKIEVWQAGRCIFSTNSNNTIIGKLFNNELTVMVDDMKVSKYIKPKFEFGEISTNADRIMWSKDIFNKTGVTEYNNPDISSLFFINGILNKITFTIHDPNTLVEFYS